MRKTPLQISGYDTKTSQMGSLFCFSVNAWIHNHHGGQVRSEADGSLPPESRPASRGWFKSPATLLKGLSFRRPFFIITLGAWIHNHHGGRDPTSCYTKSMTYVKSWVLFCFCVRFLLFLTENTNL